MVKVNILKGGRNPLSKKEVKATAIIESDNSQQYEDMVEVLSQSRFKIKSSGVSYFETEKYFATLCLE